MSAVGTLLCLNAHAEVLEKSKYRIDSEVLCDGLPQIQVGTAKGLCVGLLAGKKDGLNMPRYAVQSKEGIIYLTDMGGWTYGNGTVYAIYQAKNKQGRQQTVVVNLFPNKKLTTPNGVLMDPEGRLYIGTPTAVFRFFPRNIKTGEFNIDPSVEVIFDDFGKSIFRKEEYSSANSYNSMTKKYKNKHPLVQMAANSDFTEMYINIGAPSNQCTYGIKTIDDNGKCIQSESPLASAAVWRVKLSDDAQRKTLEAASFSRGLRNSMALAVHPISGLVIQGENGIDLPSEELPYEELNILKQDAHYGWPYCHSSGQVTPDFEGVMTPEMCLKKYVLPKIFMPAHTAPLSLLYYRNNLLSPLKNKLLVTWHGRKKYGHRIVAYPVDEKGFPTSNNYEQIVFGWDALSGVRPMGAPVGLTTLNDGSVLVIDDLNAAILRISQGKNADSDKPSETVVFSEKTLYAFQPLIPFVKKNCVMCHNQFQKNSAQEILAEMNGTMLDLSQPSESLFVQKLKRRMMPPEEMRTVLHFDDKEFDYVLPVVDEFIKTLN